MLGKLLGVATVGSALASVGLLHRFLSNIVTIVILSIVSGFMLSVLITGGFYLAYLGLVHYGLDPCVAGITVGIMIFLVTAALVIFVIARLRQMRDLMHSSSHSHGADLLDMGNVVIAFIEGFLNHKK